MRRDATAPPMMLQDETTQTFFLASRLELLAVVAFASPSIWTFGHASLQDIRTYFGRNSNIRESSDHSFS